MKNYLLAEHNLPRTLKTIIYDSIHNEHVHSTFKTSQYLLQINPANEAQVFFFNTQLTAITNNLKIKHINNEKCFVFKNKQQHYKILTCSKEEIIIFRAKVDQFTQFQQQFEAFHFKIKLQKNEEITYISESITLAEKQYYIAYTNKDEFYLISTQYEYSKYLFDCVKLTDLDDSKGIFGWFTKKQKIHYSTVKLHLVALSTGEQAIRVVSVRDSQIMVHLVELKPQLKNSTIKVVSKMNKLSTLLSSKCTLFDTYLLKNQAQDDSQEKKQAIKFIAVFKEKERTNLINIQIFISQTQVLPYCKTILNLETSFFLSIVSSFGLLFFSWFNHKTKKYIINLFSEEEIAKSNQEQRPILTTELLQTSRPYLQEDNQIFLCMGKKQVYLLGDSNIFKYETVDANLKDSALYLQNIKKLQKILYKAIQIQDYEEITIAVRKIEENYKLIASDQEEYLKQYICIFILKKVLESKDLQRFEKLVKASRHYKEYDENILAQACKQTDQQHIKKLVDFIAQIKMYELLVNDIIFEVHTEFCQKNSNLEFYRDYLRELFDDAIDDTLGNLSLELQKNNHTLKWYLILINSFVYFKEIEPEHLQPIINHNQDKFIQNIIINHQKTELFLHFFNKDKVDFDSAKIRELFESFADRQEVITFIKRLIRTNHEEWKKKEGEEKKSYLEFVRKRFTAMIQGLQQYSEILINELEYTYPGLAAYFYLKKDRKKYADKLVALANKSQNPETSYILRMASGKHKSNDQAVLDQIRLCHQLKQINLTPQELVAQLKKNNFNDVQVHRQTWQSWKKSHQNLKQDFSVMQKKLSFYRND